MEKQRLLFKRSDLEHEISIMRFNKFERMMLSNISPNLLPQFDLFDKQQFDTGSSISFFTPLMEKKTLATPGAPIKNKTRCKKGNLKPKKLQYTEDELGVCNTVNSGICDGSNQFSDTLSCKRLISNVNTSNFSQKGRFNLRNVAKKIKVQTNDKENDSSLLRITLNTSNNVTRSTAVAFDPYAEEVSQCDSNLSWKEKLYWLQPRRDIGLWIECCRKGCKKYRYTEDYHDPVDVPKIWYCEMNSDKTVASCDIPERPIPDHINDQIIENDYNAGSIVWALTYGFPWWPAIVNDCPDTYTYFKLRRNCLCPTYYFVTYFSGNKEEFQSAWVHKRNIKPLISTEYSSIIKKTRYRKIDYKKSLDRAYEIALSALPLTILERLQRFSFIARFDKHHDINNNSKESVEESQTNISQTSLENEILPSIPEKNHITLKNYYLRKYAKN